MNPISIEFKDESMQALQADQLTGGKHKSSGTAGTGLTLILTVGACVAYQTTVDVDELDGHYLWSARQASALTRVNWV